MTSRVPWRRASHSCTTRSPRLERPSAAGQLGKQVHHWVDDGRREHLVRALVVGGRHRPADLPVLVLHAVILPRARDRRSAQTRQARSRCGHRQCDPGRPIGPHRRSPVALRVLVPCEDRTETQIPLVETARPDEPTTDEPRLVLRVRPRPERLRGRGDIDSIGGHSVDGQDDGVRNAGRELPELGQDRGANGRRLRQSPQSGHLDVEPLPGPERDREVRAGLPGAVGLEGDLEPAVGEQQAGRLELRPDVAQRLGIRRPVELLADLVAVGVRERPEPRRAIEPGDQLLRERILRSTIVKMVREPLDGRPGPGAGVLVRLGLRPIRR